ncbi:hypothetical protein D3C85_1183300 [compost metagenome]
MPPDNQAQHADDLQQRRNQSGQDRCNQGRETRLLIDRQLLVGFTKKRRHDLYQGLREHLDLGRKRCPEHHRKHHSNHYADQQRADPGFTCAQNQRKPRRPQQHQKCPWVIGIQPPDQRRQQPQRQNTQGVRQSAPQQHKAPRGSTQPIQQRQCCTSGHHESGLHTASHDELS